MNGRLCVAPFDHLCRFHYHTTNIGVIANGPLWFGFTKDCTGRGDREQKRPFVSSSQSLCPDVLFLFNSGSQGEMGDMYCDDLNRGDSELQFCQESL